jgi:hypothetical protein
LLAELFGKTCRNGAQILPRLFWAILTLFYLKRINIMESMYPHTKFLSLELVALC